MSRDGPAALRADTAPVALFEADRNMVVLSVNPKMTHMTGIAAEDLIGRSFRTFLTRSSQFVYALKAEPALLMNGAAEEIFLELNHADGRPRAALLTVEPSARDGGRLCGALFAAPERRAYELELIATRRAIMENIEELKQAKQALQTANVDLERLVQERTEALDQRDLLLREVYHRVKNNMQVVDGLLLLQSRRIKDPEAVAAIDGLRKRVFALGLIHHQLMGSTDLKTFDVRAFLSELATHLRAGAPDNVTLHIVSAPIQVDLDFAVPLGLLVTELTTNALKHAFPAGAGQINVTLDQPGDEEVVLRVADSGVGFSQVPPADPKPSLGLTIVEGLVRQLGGRIQSTEAQGVCWEARLPAPKVA